MHSDLQRRDKLTNTAGCYVKEGKCGTKGNRQKQRKESPPSVLHLGSVYTNTDYGTPGNPSSTTPTHVNRTLYPYFIPTPVWERLDNLLAHPKQ